MFFHPIWSSAEACQWQMCELVAVLGTFEPTRARLRTSLEGSPYSSDPDANTYVMKSQVKPMSYLINSAMLNYYMWYGLYAAIYNDAVDRDEWRTALTSVNGELQMLYTPHMRAFVIGILLNQEVPTNMMHGAGFYVSLDRMEEVRRITHTAPGTSGEEADVIVDALYAPVSGSLVLGTMSGDLEVVQHLKSTYRVDFRGTRTEVYDQVELLKTANIYRLFGHQITLFDNVTQEQINPWAAVNECVIEPSSIAFDPKEVRKLTLGWSDAREGRTVPLPALGSLGVGGFLSVTIQKPHLETIKFRTSQTPVKVYVTAKRSKKPLPIKIKSGYSFRPETFQARKGLSYVQKDFHSAPLRPPPDNPEGEVVAGPSHTTVHTGELPPPADAAGSSTVLEKSQEAQETHSREALAKGKMKERATTSTGSTKTTLPTEPPQAVTTLLDSGGTTSSQH
nr:putative capsid protein [Poaceae Liege totivirus 13]